MLLILAKYCTIFSNADCKSAHFSNFRSTAELKQHSMVKLLNHVCADLYKHEVFTARPEIIMGIQFDEIAPNCIYRFN